MEIWEESPRVSFITKRRLPDTEDARSYYFSHVLPKGKAKYPMFKYYKKNIVLKTLQEHELWEHHKYKLRDLPQWREVFELERQLKKEYQQHKQDYESGRTEEYFKY